MYSEDRKLVFLSSAAHAFELRLSTQGARALFMALGRLFFPGFYRSRYYGGGGV